MNCNNVKNPDELYELGLLHMRGDGVPVNPVTAVGYFIEALNMGHRKAAECLGEACYLGLGIAKDELIAEDYFYKFVPKTYKKVPMAWEWIKNNVEFNASLSFDDYCIAASGGNVEAQKYLMQVYSRHFKTTYNEEQYAYWTEKVAYSGDSFAQKEIATCYRLGLGVTQDFTQAKMWYAKILEINPNDPSALLGITQIQCKEREAQTASCSAIKDGILTKYTGKAKQIYIPENVKVIGEDSFAENEYIEEVYIEYPLSSIKAGAFNECCNLRKIKLPYGLTEIGDSAFFATHLTEVELPLSLERIGDCAFSDTDLRSICIPQNVTKIGWQVFDGCKKLQVARFESVKEIGPSAFAYCSSLRTVVLPDSVDKIDPSAFEECPNLKTVDASEQWKHSHPALLRCILQET